MAAKKKTTAAKKESPSTISVAFTGKSVMDLVFDESGSPKIFHLNPGSKFEVADSSKNKAQLDIYKKHNLVNF